MESSFLSGVPEALRKVDIHFELVRHASQIVEVIVHMHPLGLGVGLDLMSNYARPSGGVNDYQIGITVLNPLPAGVICLPQLGISFTSLRREEGLGMGGAVDSKQNIRFFQFITSEYNLTGHGIRVPSRN